MNGKPQPQDPPGAAGLLTDPSFWRSKTGRRDTRTSRVGERHYLVPPLGQPIPLESSQGSVLVIGRDPTCDLVVESPTVSRQHAELRFKGLPPRPYVKDRGTVNGTLVNANPVQGERPLADGDVLRLGDVTAVYRHVPPGRTLLLRRARPGAEQLNATIPVNQGRRPLGGLAGDVSLFPMSDLLGRLMLLKATGDFVVEVDGVPGHLRFENGTVRSGAFAGREGQEAIRALSELRRGTFRFQPA